MTNKKISDIFVNIADILEIKGDIVFKIRAYRTAALHILALGRPLKDIYGDGSRELTRIQGIGKDLSAKIIEILETGKLKYYDELMKEFPEGFLDLLKLPGLGPKKLKRLRDEIGIGTMDELEKACKDGEVASIEGMGKKSQEKLIEAIDYHRRSAGRMLLPQADNIAQALMGYIAETGLCKKLEKAGSLRRGQETIGDIDILAVSKDDAALMDRFVSYPEMAGVIAKGPTKSSIILKSGAQVDLRIVDKDAYGSALVYFTGSQAHNIKLRKIAKNNGLKVSEYGVFKVNSKNGKETYVAGRAEKDVYEALGLGWVPPELREDQGEVEAVSKGELPSKLIKLTDIKGDLHVHSTSSDGRNTIEEMARAALAKGYEYITIADHTKNVKIAGGMNDKEYLKHIDHIRKLDSKIKGIRVLAGAEVDILKDGQLDLTDDVLKELDIVIIAIHSNFTLEREVQTERVLKAMDNKYVNILAHPSGRLITRRSPLELDFDRIFEHARVNNVVMEINTHGERVDLNSILAKEAAGKGIKFSINTDSHDTAQLDNIQYGVMTARRGWLERTDVINTYPLEKLRKVLAK